MPYIRCPRCGLEARSAAPTPSCAGCLRRLDQRDCISEDHPLAQPLLQDRADRLSLRMLHALEAQHLRDLEAQHLSDPTPQR